MLEVNYKGALKNLHTRTVSHTIISLDPNRVLGTNPPEVHASESLLPRDWKGTLSQLRSGFSKTLNTYLHRIHAAPDAICPQCGSHPHTTTHLFSCPAHPTPLTPIDLWLHPQEVALFLKDFAPFCNLSNPPAPRPPPEPD